MHQVNNINPIKEDCSFLNINENKREIIPFQENTNKSYIIKENCKKASEVNISAKLPAKNNNNISELSKKKEIKQSKKILENIDNKKNEKKNNIPINSNEDNFVLKNNKLSQNKSVNKSDKKGRILEEKENDMNLNFQLKKFKKIYSFKKNNDILSFVDKNNNTKDFKLFKDSDIGFGKEYKIKYLFQDNDVDSSDELIKRGVKTNLLNISSAIKMMKNKTNEEFIGKYENILNI